MSQHLEALKVANEVRLGSVEIRNELRRLARAEALERAADLLLDPPYPIQRTRIDRFLKSLPSCGDVYVYDLLYRLRVHPMHFIGPYRRHRAASRVMSERQRWDVAEALRRRAL
jgi:hypothetical protein